MDLRTQRVWKSICRRSLVCVYAELQTAYTRTRLRWICGFEESENASVEEALFVYMRNFKQHIHEQGLDGFADSKSLEIYL